ncbi:DNA polymerase III subunit gamma/tau (plasmid) [Paenibacillus peoriae]|uniref:DNA polymerase III subunit gamma/tau n=1 Tax=Paenibacillus peoriae TaxID=59893 RepID=A0A7H0YH67_9BACL|nr:DNA polymerase III subunit gamma/tau [Paenibacillus peoriae]QNR70425.1 DNA polymerase III subunit gamma/tau [Paenibacillus peoriae]
MSDRELTIPNENQESVPMVAKSEPAPETDTTKEPLSKEEADVIEKVFFEEDDMVRLRDGRTYRIPPLGLKDARKLMRKLNTIDTSIVISNLIDTDGEDRYDELLDVLMMAFRPYYKTMTVEYLEDYIDLVSAKQIIDSMIGLNGLKKLL